MTYGCMGLVLLGPWLWLAQDSPQQTSLITRPTQSSNSFLATSSSADSWNGIKDAPWLDFAQSRGAWGMLLAHCARNWGLYTMLAWLPTFYAEQYGLGVRDSAWLSVMPSVAGAAGGFLAGSLADRIVRNLRDPTDEQSVTFVRKVFQSVGLLGPAVVLASLAYHIPDQAWTAQLFFMAAVGLQSFNAGGFEAANQDKAGPKWAGMLYSVTSLPAVMCKFLSYGTGIVSFLKSCRLTSCHSVSIACHCM